MSTLFLSKTSNFKNCASEIRPITNWSEAGLESCFLMNSLGDRQRNLARGKPDGIIIGTPVQGAGYLTFQAPNSYIETNLPETDEGTIAAAVRIAGASGQFGIICGTNQGDSVNHPGSASLGVALLQSGTGASVHAQVGYWDGSAPETVEAVPGLTLSSWQLLICRYGAGGVKAFNMTLNGGTSTSTAHARLRNINTLRIGGIPTNTTGSPVDMAMFMHFSRQIADAEMNPLYMQMKAIVADDSIVV